MTALSSRRALILSTTVFLLLSIVIAFMISMVVHLNVAHAAGQAADPVVLGQTASDTGWQLISQYGPFWGAFLLVYGLIGALMRANESKHWIAQGRRLSGLTAGLMILGAVADWKFHGAQLAGVVVTVIMAIKLVWSPTVTPAPSDPATGGSGSASGIAKASAIAMLALCASCATAQRIGDDVKTAGHAILDCTKQLVNSNGGLLALALDFAIQGERDVQATGSVNWDALADRALALGTADAVCAYAEYKQAKNPPAAAAMVARAAPDAKLEQMRVKLDVGTIHTSRGDL